MAKRALLALAATVAALVAAAPAGACADRVLSQPFLPWLDVASYTLVPDGALESASSWKLAGDAKLVTGNEPYYVNSPSDARSLHLPSRSSATTAPVCVGLLDPTLRFFAINTGSSLSELVVDLIYTDATGRSRQLTVATVLSLGVWAPTLPIAFLANVTQVLSLDGLTTEVRFRFRPTHGLLGKGNWRIDDVYVDPMIVW